MKKILKIAQTAIQVLLSAPLHLSNKAVQIVKYIAIGLGLIEEIVDKDQKEDPDENE